MNLNKMADACFDMLDTDGSGFMDTDELHKALISLYDKLNSTLNCNMKHPTMEDVHAMLVESEVGEDRPTISKQEFRDMVTGNFSSRKFTETIAFKVRRSDFCISWSDSVAFLFGQIYASTVDIKSTAFEYRRIVGR